MVPFGQLAWFGNLSGAGRLIFTGSGALSTVKSAWPKGFSPKYVNPLVNTGGAFPLDAGGLGPMPLDGTPQMQYLYILLAPASYSDSAAFKYLRTQWNSAWTFFGSSYTWNGHAGTSGQRGYLVVNDEDPTVTTQYYARARCLEPGPFELVAGLPHELHITLTFGLLEEFSTVAP